MKHTVEWNFPSGLYLTPTGSNNAAVETFRDNVIDSLTREILQNSLDAHNPDREDPVHVSFDKIRIKNNEIPKVNTLTNYALPRANKFWEKIGDKDTLKFLSKFEDTINNDEISVLKVSDFNTTGLLPKNYQSLVRADAYSEKSDNTASGSKGIGKAAPFAASDLRTVFYSSYSIDNIDRSAGILNFVSFNPGEQEHEITQSRASYLDITLDTPSINKQLNFNNKLRNQDNYGTDIFILGFKQFENWVQDIKLSTLENFLVAIYNNNLSVSVDGEKIDKNNLNDILENIDMSDMNRPDKDRVQVIKNYYQVLTSPDTKRIDFDERFAKYDFINDLTDGFLLILEHEPANRRILQTRQAGMKIYDRTHISGTINFTGVFQAVGDELNSYLRDIENPNHNDWLVDRIDQDNKKEKKIARKLLEDLYQWYKSKVKENFEEAIEDKVGAFGVADLLPILSEDDSEDNDSNDEEDTGISFKIGSFKSTKRKAAEILSGSVKDEDARLDRLAREMDGSTSEGFDDEDVGEEGGTGGEDGDGEDTGGESRGGLLGDPGQRIERKVSYHPIKSSQVMRVKLIEHDASEGKYKLKGKNIGKNKIIALTFNYIDGSGMKEESKLLETSSRTNEVHIEDNKIIIKNLSKNDLLNIDFEVNKNLRLKMRIDTYEIRT